MTNSVPGTLHGPPVGYAHRGFSLVGAENTLVAFQAAVELGYRHLETDARVSVDGVAVAFHDDLLDRVTNHSGRLSDLTWRQIQQARVLGAEPILSLADLLAGFPDTQVNIDVKSHAAIGPTLDAIGQTASWSRVRLAAFSHTRLAALRGAAGPSAPSALSPREVLALKLAERDPRWRSRRAAVPARGLPRRTGLAAQVPGDPRLGVITARFVATAHRHGIEVHAWTVNRQSEMNRLLDLGVDAVITDRADLLRDVLIGRGQWPT